MPLNCRNFLINVLMPFVATNISLGLILALALAAIGLRVWGHPESMGFGIRNAEGTITISQKLLGGFFISLVLFFNQLLVILAMACLKKFVSKLGPLRFAVFSSAITGAVLGLLIGLAIPSGFEIHSGGLAGPSGGISWEPGKVIDHPNTIELAVDIVSRIIAGSIFGLIWSVIYGIAGFVLAPINGLCNLAKVI